MILYRGLRKPNCQSLPISQYRYSICLCIHCSVHTEGFLLQAPPAPPEGILWYPWPTMGRLKLIPLEIALWWASMGSYPNFDTTVPRVEQLCAMFYNILIDPRLPTVMSWCVSHPLLTGFSFLPHVPIPLVVLPGTTSQINYLLSNSHFKVFF